jgi:hypothetical protein
MTASTIYLGLAVALLVVGFAILAFVIHDRISSPASRFRQSRGAVVAGIFILGFAVASGISFFRYSVLSQIEGQQYRLLVYERFSELPKVERLAGAGLRTYIENADTVAQNGTMWLTVALWPHASFIAQFPSSGPRDKLWLKMTINAPGFDVSPVLDETQQVPGDVMTFAWILRARESGDQVVNIHGIAFGEAQGKIHDRATVVNAMRSIWIKPSVTIDSWTPIVTALIGLLGSSALVPLLQLFLRRSPEVSPVKQ